jgi:hypothetical protein
MRRVSEYFNRNLKTILALVGILVAIMAHAAYELTTQFTKTITVDRTFTGIDSETNSNQMSFHTSYNVLDTRGDIFEVVNSLWLWSWDKTRMWGLLKPGEQYQIHGFGKYVGMLSWCPSIVHVAKV